MCSLCQAETLILCQEKDGFQKQQGYIQTVDPTEEHKLADLVRCIPIPSYVKF